jgi:hypothetical protein
VLSAIIGSLDATNTTDTRSLRMSAIYDTIIDALHNCVCVNDPSSNARTRHASVGIIQPQTFL